ncbi:MarR family transcriptional regulator [Sediminihabitans luteus]|uniref:MarR family transcriptional regulator n=1 Tax=Sediminihabitans luteus TaxID=1138585 RepID=A0A2M9CEY7_9CELL|nr:MarR family transcriptional regulator [Sediminihabitans luteus]GII97894.1 hypothetical protein Slu03_02720 [Sediminihabitans luteus]
MPDTSDVAADLRSIVGRLRRRLREESGEHDLTPSQTAALGHLGRLGPATVTDLARAERMRPQSMGAIVAALEQAGLVTGTPDPCDRRRTLLDLTPQARERLAAHRAARQDWLHRTIATELDTGEQQTLANAVALLRRLVES